MIAGCISRKRFRRFNTPKKKFLHFDRYRDLCLDRPVEARSAVVVKPFLQAMKLRCNGLLLQR